MDTELRELLIAIGRTPGTFRRDTPLLLETLDNLEAVNRRFKNIRHVPERRKIVDIRCRDNLTPCERRRKSSDNTCEHYPESHTSICHEYWDRGLDCQCIPESVKQDIRNGANPDDLF